MKESNQPKSLIEIKDIIRKFPKAGGAGFVVILPLMKLAESLGMPGYDLAIIKWLNRNPVNDVTFSKGDEVPTDLPFYLSWEGPAIRIVGESFYVGIEETLRNIELCLTK